MKLTRKISVALVLVMLLMMTLAIIPASATGETKTIYLNPGEWDKDGAWFSTWAWSGSGSGAWYTFTKGDVYYEVTVPATVDGMILLRKGSSQKEGWECWNRTGNRTVSGNLVTITKPWDNFIEGDAASGAKVTWSNYTPTCTDHSFNEWGICQNEGCGAGHYYTVAGSEALCGTDWDTANTANDMTYADGVYTKVYTNVKAGTYKFKCVQDHAWTTAYPGSDYVLEVEKDGTTVTITLTANKTVEVTKEAPECDHNYESTTTATCTEGGETTYTCSKCSDTYTDKDVKALGHNYVDGACTREGCEAVTKEVTVYFDNAANWEKVYVYTFQFGHIGEVAWPGTEITPVDGVYSVVVPAGQDRIIFNNGSDAHKTENLVTPLDCHNKYNNELGNWVSNHTFDKGECTACGEKQEHNCEEHSSKATCMAPGVCEICGTKTAEKAAHGSDACTCTLVKLYNVAGWENAFCHYWGDCEATTWPGAQMTKHDDGYYYCYVPAGATGIVYTAGKDGPQTANLTVEEATNHVNATVDLVGDMLLDGENWAFQSMTYTDGKFVITVTLEAGTYSFKIVKNGAWYGNEGEINDTTITADYNGGWDMTVDVKDCTLIAKGGKYTFTFDASTNKLNVEWECIHAYGNGVVTEPTCVSGGHTEYTCSVCGHSYIDNETEATPDVHEYVHGDCKYCDAVLPSITEDGVFDLSNLESFKGVDADEHFEITGTTTTEGSYYKGYRDNGDSMQFPTGGSIQFIVASGKVVTIVGHSAGYGQFDIYLNGVKAEVAHTGSYTFVIREDTAITIEPADGKAGNAYIKSIKVEADKTIYDNVTVNFGTEGNYKDSGIDFSGIKISDNGGNNSQVKEGSFTFSVGAGAMVYIHGYPGYTNYSINSGDAITEEHHYFVAFEATTITVTPLSGNNYFYSLEITFHTDLKHNEGKASTCTVKGYEAYYSCSCHGELNKVELELAEHPYNAVVTAPTCTVKGYTTYTCTACGDTYTADETAALEHSYKAVVTDPTCTATGYTTYTCERTGCGHSYTADETEMVEHSYEPETTAPTCTAFGYTVYTCSACGDHYTVTGTEKADHNYNGVVTAPTCEDKGYTTYTCSACGDHYVADETAAKGHNHTSKVTVQPGCTTEGVRTYTCACGNTYTEAVAARGHSEKDLPAVAPTCTETGLTAGKQCTACDTFTVPQETIPAKGHQYDDKYDAFCNVCNFERDAECAHTNTETIPAVAPTCTATGLTAGQKCTNPKCGEIVVAQTVVPATGHTAEVLPAKDPTCTETGLEAGEKCSVCGTVTVEQKVVNALGHSFTNYKSDNNATCTANGTETAKCDRCDATHTKTAEGSKLAHNQDVNVPGKAATCTATGLTDGKKCSGCGATTVAQETIPAKGHSEEIIPGKAATCTETGLEDGKKCSVCGTVTVEQKTISAKGHTEETLPAVAPTCTATGLSEGKKCSVCDTVITAQTEIAAKGHTEETLAAKAPTCTETGLTEGKKCTTCGTVLLAQEEVPATGHLYVYDVCAYCYDVHPTFVVGDTHYVINDLLVAAEADYRYIYIAEPGLYEVTGGAPLTIFIWNESPNAVLTGNEPYVWNVDMSTYLHLSSFLVEFKEAGLYWIGFNFAQVGDLREFDINIAKHAHSFADATCTAPKTCKCGATEGDALGHSFVEGKCECGAEDPNYVPPHEHKFEEGKCACGAEDPNYVAPDQPTPEQPTPEQPAEELGFFEAIWAAIVAFFASIGDFFKNLFTPKQ